MSEDIATLEATLETLPPPLRKPVLVMVCGLPGSGKSYFSRALGQRYPLVHLDSDRLRKALFRRPSHSHAEGARLFAAVHTLIERLLARNLGVILDATSFKEVYREPLYEIAERAGAGLVIVWTEAPEAVAIERLEGRARGGDPLDASAATADVYNRMRREAEPVARAHMVVDTSRDIAPALGKVLREIEKLSGGPA